MRTRRGLSDSFAFAFDGIIYAFKTQRNLRLHFLLASFALVGSMFVPLSRAEKLILFLTIALVIVAEMINTAIEAVVDLYVQTYHPLAKIAKNVAAGAVFIAALNAVFVGYILFFEQFTAVALNTLKIIEHSPVYVTAVCLVLVIILVVVGKAISSKGEADLIRGIPSGHTALAFAATTAMALVSQNGLVTILGLFVACLVGENQVAARIHSLLEVLAGAVMGILITILAFQLFT